MHNVVLEMEKLNFRLRFEMFEVFLSSISHICKNRIAIIRFWQNKFSTAVMASIH